MFTHWFVSNNGVLKFNVRRRETSESDIARYNRSRAGGRYAESNPVSCNPKNQIWDDAEKSWYAICTDPAAESTVGYIPPVWHAPLWLDRASFRSRRIHSSTVGSSDFVQYTHHTALVLPTSDSVTHAELQALPRRRRLVVPGSGGRRTSRLAPLRMCWSRRLNGDHALARGSRCKSRARRASIASRRRSSPRSSAAAGRAPEAPWPAAAARSRRSRSAG